MGGNAFGEPFNEQPMSASLGSLYDVTDMTLPVAVANPATGQPLEDNEGEVQPLELVDNQLYAVVFVVAPEEGELEFIAGDSGAGTPNDISATNFALANNEINIRYGASIVCPLNNGGDFDTELGSLDFTDGYWFSNQPWLEMNIGAITVNTEEITAAAIGSVDVFPNPVSDVLVVDVTLEERSQTVSFELTNINGELVKKVIKNNVLNGKFNLAVGELPGGVYTLNVRSEAGFVSKKVVIAD